MCCELAAFSPLINVIRLIRLIRRSTLVRLIRLIRRSTLVTLIRLIRLVIKTQISLITVRTQ